jgi:hypothetical protein
MKKIFLKTFALAIGFTVLSPAGCQQPEKVNMKKSRLIAVENARLKKELDFYKNQIEKLTRQHNQEHKKQQKLLAECMQEKESWKQKARQGVENQVRDVFEAVMEQNTELIEENKKLKAEIRKLRR